MNKKGFTLVEMVAVVVILGVLLFIAVPTYNTFIAKTRNTKQDVDVSAIKDATKTLISDCVVNTAPTGMNSYCTSFRSGTAKIEGDSLTTYFQALKSTGYLGEDVVVDGIKSIEVEYDSSKYNYEITVSFPSETDPTESE